MSEVSVADMSEDMPTPDQLRAEIKSHSRPKSDQKLENRYEKEFNQLSISAEMAYLHIAGLKDHYEHKKKWSHFLMTIMGVMIGFQCLLLGLVGANIWDYSKYKWLLPLLLAQNLAQIVGLAVFVVKSLFRDMSEKGTKA